MEETVSFCGHVLTAGELSLVRQTIADFPRLSQAELAYTICELLEWRRPNGKLKQPECVEWLQKWQQQTLPSLPELRVTKPQGAHRLLADDPQCDPQPPLRGRLADYQPLRLQLIADLAGRRLFQQYVQRYHPLGYRVPYGAQLRYLVRASSQDVSLPSEDCANRFEEPAFRCEIRCSHWPILAREYRGGSSSPFQRVESERIFLLRTL